MLIVLFSFLFSVVEFLKIIGMIALGAITLVLIAVSIMYFIAHKKDVKNDES